MYILYDSIGIKFKIRQNKSLVCKVKLRVSLARDVWNGREREKVVEAQGFSQCSVSSWRFCLRRCAHFENLKYGGCACICMLFCMCQQLQNTSKIFLKLYQQIYTKMTI